MKTHHIKPMLFGTTMAKKAKEEEVAKAELMRKHSQQIVQIDIAIKLFTDGHLPKTTKRS